MIRTFIATFFVLLSLVGCAGTPKPPPITQAGVLVIPRSGQTSPIALKQPNQVVTLTASETGYAAGFSASIFSGEHCVNLAPVPGSMNQFVVTRILGCNSILIKIVDDVGHSASVYLVTQ